jgi:hypothetical protein
MTSLLEVRAQGLRRAYNESNTKLSSNMIAPYT